MTPAQIKLIQDSWERFNPPSLMVFYEHLFALRPDLRPMFRRSMEEQEAKLRQTLMVVVASLEHLDEILEDVRDLGRRHVGYGARPEDYKDVGDALLMTLSEGMGKLWTRELNRAWSEAYDLLARTMIEAAREASREVAAAEVHHPSVAPPVTPIVPQPVPRTDSEPIRA